MFSGLDQPGFLRDSNFLLPWDIPIPKGSALDPSWPVPSESASGGGRKGGKHRDKRGHKGMRTTNLQNNTDEKF